MKGQSVACAVDAPTINGWAGEAQKGSGYKSCGLQIDNARYENGPNGRH